MYNQRRAQEKEGSISVKCGRSTSCPNWGSLVSEARLTMKINSRTLEIQVHRRTFVSLLISELQSGGQHRGTRPKWKGTTPEQDGKMPLRNIKVSSLTPSTENTLPNQQTHRQTRKDIGGDSKVENSMDLEVSHTRDTTLETNFDHHQLILCSQLGK